MTVHPLKWLAAASWMLLILAQISLLWRLDHPAWTVAATIPLLIPVGGMIRDRLYTYKWFGFVTLGYFCVGVSELVANPALRLYALATLVGSLGLLFSSIYYIRYLARRPPPSNT